MFRVNIQITNEASITSGEGIPGGTGGVLFVDSVSNKLKLIYPDGSSSIAKVGEVDVAFVKG